MLEAANRFLREEYRAEFNRRFRVPATQSGTALVPLRGQDRERIFSVQQERVVHWDNTADPPRRTSAADREDAVARHPGGLPGHGL